MRNAFLRFIYASVFCGMASVTSATLLVPDTNTALGGTTVADNPNLAGMVVEDVITFFSFSAYGGTVNGHVQNRVVLSVDGTYDFYWRVFNHEDSSGDIGSFRIGEFLASTFDANWRIDSLGDVPPLTAYLFGGMNGYVNFSFTNEAGEGTLLPGSSSYFIFLDTDATSYDMSAIYDVTNVGQTEISGLFNTFTPSNSVPAPGALLLMGLGLVLLRRRS